MSPLDVSHNVQLYTNFKLYSYVYYLLHNNTEETFLWLYTHTLCWDFNNYSIHQCMNICESKAATVENM